MMEIIYKKGSTQERERKVACIPFIYTSKEKHFVFQVKANFPGRKVVILFYQCARHQTSFILFNSSHLMNHIHPWIERQRFYKKKNHQETTVIFKEIQDPQK